MTRSLPEWRGPTPDAAIPPRVKARIFERDGGRCRQCTRQVGAGREPFAFDHVVALANGGEHAEGNLQLLCQTCHAVKTRADVAEKSAVYRKRAKHLSIKKAARPMPGSRASKWKRRMDGTLVERNSK